MNNDDLKNISAFNTLGRLTFCLKRVLFGKKWFETILLVQKCCDTQVGNFFEYTERTLNITFAKFHTLDYFFLILKKSFRRKSQLRPSRIFFCQEKKFFFPSKQVRWLPWYLFWRGVPTFLGLQSRFSHFFPENKKVIFIPSNYFKNQKSKICSAGK
jgi:hypothetical protein